MSEMQYNRRIWSKRFRELSDSTIAPLVIFFACLCRIEQQARQNANSAISATTAAAIPVTIVSIFQSEKRRIRDRPSNENSRPVELPRTEDTSGVSEYISSNYRVC